MRQQGYYWVKYQDEWEIAQYRAHKTEDGILHFWSLPAIIYEGWWHTDNDFQEIDERRIERNPVITVKDEDLFAVITRYGNHGMTKEEIEEGCKQTISLNPPKYISDNPYLCKPDES